MDDSRPVSGNDPAGNTKIVDAFLAAIEAGVPEEEAGRQAAAANIDMLSTMVAERILAKTDAAVAGWHARCVGG